MPLKYASYHELSAFDELKKLNNITLSFIQQQKF